MYCEHMMTYSAGWNWVGKRKGVNSRLGEDAP